MTKQLLFGTWPVMVVLSSWFRAIVPAGLLLVLLAGSSGVARAGVALCTGDCDGDKSVRIPELVTIVNIALGLSALDVCSNGDSDRDGAVQIDELVRAVAHALGGCRGDLEPKPFKNRVDHPSDSYLAFPATTGGPAWVKFTILLDDPQVVYFQNSSQTPFHYDFVSTSIEPYLGWSPAEIDAVSLRAEGQEMVFGAVLYSPIGPREVAIQLVGQDAYSVAQVIAYFDAVRAAVDAAEGVPFFYFPTFEQQSSANQNSAALEAAGIRLGSTARWSTGDVCYAAGWGYGRLVFVEGDDIDTAYADGTLGPSDILVTDGVPAEIPFVAGVLSLAPSTPNSHVAILAADWGVPFAFLATDQSVDVARAVIGREVVVRATPLSPRVFVGEILNFDACQVRVVDVEGALDEATVAYLSDLKRAPDLAIRPFVASATYTSEVDTATPDDIVTIGGKAANYGFLLREIPDNTRPAMAFTFDLWVDYIGQSIDGGATLRERIEELLAPFPSYPPNDFGVLFAALDEVRDLIDDVADFSPAQRTAILEALVRFAPTRKVRFRSSTNVEDSDVFTGAGLYESKSGCLADDLDEDSDGPSRCDPGRDKERGVFRALRKVFQSFYNDNAFLERLRHRVDERSVGMAVLVHHNFPDETELANGVATLRTAGPSSSAITIVSQPDAFSVTNPEGGGVPEVVEVSVFSSGVFPSLRQGADRVQLGATVLEMPGEYVALSELLLEVGEAFGEFFNQTQFNLEFEFKKIAGEGLVVKQVRRIAGVTPGFDTTPVLIDAPSSLCTFQAEEGDVFANYRLKSRWTPEFVSGPVELGGASFYAGGEHRFVLDGEISGLAGAPSTWTDAEHDSFQPHARGVLAFTESWSVGSGATRRVMTLETEVPTNIGPAFIPIVFPDDLAFTLQADHAVSVPFWNFGGDVGSRTVEQVRLTSCLDQRPITARHVLRSLEFDSGAVAIDTSFYWPPFPTGAVAGYTAPLDRWVGTRIAGVVAGSVSLQGYFSQTYRPAHHNFSAAFIFDPHLEEEFDQDTLGEWDETGIVALFQPLGDGAPAIRALTEDGDIVELGDLP